jgi:hypothetical protein
VADDFLDPTLPDHSAIFSEYFQRIPDMCIEKTLQLAAVETRDLTPDVSFVCPARQRPIHGNNLPVTFICERWCAIVCVKSNLKPHGSTRTLGR